MMAYDAGSLPSGLVSLAPSAKPERVLTPEQWTALQQHLNSATEENTDG